MLDVFSYISVILISLNSVSNYSTIISNVQDSIQTDMKLDTMMKLVNTQLDSGKKFTVTSQEVTGTGSAKTSYLWESASTIENNKIITHIDNNGKSDGTVSLSTSYK